ncbi:MAG: hypothetical protein AAF547_08930 [Actinomycetota bacterium]
MTATGRPGDEPWRHRYRAARDLIASYRDDPTTTDRVARAELALAEATSDHDGLVEAIATLDPDRVTGELKSVLRTRPDPTAPDTPLIRSLRQRYMTMHSLKNRRTEIEGQIEATLIDLETVAARCIELSHVRGGTGMLDEELTRLNDDIEALRQAHEELDRLPGGPAQGGWQ